MRTAALVALAILGLAGCGGDDDAPPAPPAAQTTPAPTAPPGDPAAATGRFPEQAQVDLDFERGDSLAAARSGSMQGDSYVIRLTRAGTARAPAPATARPGTAAAYVVGTVRAPERLRGRAGVYCRGSEDGGYELTLDRDGDVRLDRVQGGRRTLIAGYRDEVGAGVPADAPIPLILVCGEGDDGRGVTLGVTIGAQQMTFVRDDEPFDPGASAEAGLVASGPAGSEARFGDLQLFLAL